jgi:hypothetical protein
LPVPFAGQPVLPLDEKDTDRERDIPPGGMGFYPVGNYFSQKRYYS